AERQRWHGPRARRRDVRHRRLGARQEGLRKVAGPRARAAVRRARPGAHDGFPVGVLGDRVETSWGDESWGDVPGVQFGDTPWAFGINRAEGRVISHWSLVIGRLQRTNDQ